MLKNTYLQKIMLTLIFSALTPNLGFSAQAAAPQDGGEQKASATGEDWFSKWASDSQYRFDLGVGGLMTRYISGTRPLGTTIQAAVEFDAWYKRNVGVYAYAAKNIMKTGATTFGAGVKVPVVSVQLGDAGSFLNGFMVYLAGDYSALSYDRPVGAPVSFNEKPNVARFGVGTNIGIGPSSTYLNASMMFFNTGDVTYIAPSGHIGYSF